ncbi:MAG: ABC transporter substrate-binding protein [Alphaproteobacteria bacterium]
MIGTLRGALAGLAMVAIVPGAAIAGSVPESSEPIKLAINEWTGQHITTTIAGKILQRMGYTVEYVTAGYYPQLQAIADNDVTATLEIWMSNIGEGYGQAVGSGQAEELGDLGLATREAWWYPAYVEELCPGLPDWTALKNCADIFATPDTLPSGRFVDYPADWGDLNNPRIKALGLDFVSIPAGTEGNIIAEIKSAVEKKQPILTMFWTPHWLHAEIEMHQVKLPTYEDACTTDPAWGQNLTETFDCDWPEGRPVFKLAWVGMKDTWPAAYKFLKAYQLTAEEQIPMLYKVDAEGLSIDAVTEEWVENNKDKWQAWVDAAMM